jgi:hypothetical protein
MTKQDSWKLVKIIKEHKESWQGKAIKQGQLLQLVLERKRGKSQEEEEGWEYYTKWNGNLPRH